MSDKTERADGEAVGADGISWRLRAEILGVSLAVPVALIVAVFCCVRLLPRPSPFVAVSPWRDLWRRALVIFVCLAPSLLVEAAAIHAIAKIGTLKRPAPLYAVPLWAAQYALPLVALILAVSFSFDTRGRPDALNRRISRTIREATRVKDICESNGSRRIFQSLARASVLGRPIAAQGALLAEERSYSRNFVRGNAVSSARKSFARALQVKKNAALHRILQLHGRFWYMGSTMRGRARNMMLPWTILLISRASFGGRGHVVAFVKGSPKWIPSDAMAGVIARDRRARARENLRPVLYQQPAGL